MNQKIKQVFRATCMVCKNGMSWESEKHSSRNSIVSVIFSCHRCGGKVMVEYEKNRN